MSDDEKDHVESQWEFCVCQNGIMGISIEKNFQFGNFLQDNNNLVEVGGGRKAFHLKQHNITVIKSNLASFRFIFVFAIENRETKDEIPEMIVVCYECCSVSSTAQLLLWF